MEKIQGRQHKSGVCGTKAMPPDPWQLCSAGDGRWHFFRRTQLIEQRPPIFHEPLSNWKRRQVEIRSLALKRLVPNPRCESLADPNAQRTPRESLHRVSGRGLIDGIALKQQVFRHVAPPPVLLHQLVAAFDSMTVRRSSRHCLIVVNKTGCVCPSIGILPVAAKPSLAPQELNSRKSHPLLYLIHAPHSLLLASLLSVGDSCPNWPKTELFSGFAVKL